MRAAVFVAAVTAAPAFAAPPHRLTLKPLARSGAPEVARSAQSCREGQRLAVQRRVVGQAEVMILHDCGGATPTTSMALRDVHGWFESRLGHFARAENDPGRGETRTWLIDEHVSSGALADRSPVVLHILELGWWHRSMIDDGSGRFRVDRGRELVFQVCSLEGTPACEVSSLECPAGVCPVVRLRDGVVRAGDRQLEFRR